MVSRRNQSRYLEAPPLALASQERKDGVSLLRCGGSEIYYLEHASDITKSYFWKTGERQKEAAYRVLIKKSLERGRLWGG